ncbi:MAG: cell division ATP-binding protein FtsE [Candidatus Gastranaerophilales bacterium]|nr:cell division ATP-binding protein FtsE [Candidatus Gastranaerophilales bacterium]
MIKLVDVTKNYSDTFALKDVNLEIAKGDFVFLVGSSGAGKSTLMKLLYREELPSEGKVYVGGVDVSRISTAKVPNLRRCMGIIFQDYKLLPNQTVYDNVAYVIRTLGMSSRDIDMRVKGAVKIVGLSHKLHSRPTELSGGEQQRVGIARAIVNGPPLLIADEPTGNLDPATSMEIMEILDQINKRGITIIVSTHDHAIVDHYRKRVITLDAGRVIRDIEHGTYD